MEVRPLTADRISGILRISTAPFRCAARSLGAIVLLACFTSNAFADQTTGTLSIRVPDPAAGAIVVEITSGNEPDRRWTARAEAGEGATIVGFPPAVYRITGTDSGGAAIDPLEVAVGAGEVVSLSVGRGAGSAAGWQWRVADRSQRAHGTYFDARTLRDIPAGSGVWGLLDAAAPFVVTDQLDTGGLGLGATRRTGSRGASWTETRLALGEFRVAEHPDAPDRVALFPDLHAFDTVALSAGLATPDVATPGATITLVPRRPGALRRSAIDASFTAPGMVSTNRSAVAPSIERLDSWKSVNLEFGGPVARRTGVFVSGSAAAMSESERDRSGRRSSSVASAFAHVVANPGDRTQIRLIASAQRVKRPYAPLQFLDASPTERDGFLHSQATWEHQTASGARVEAAVGVQRGKFTPDAGVSPTLLMDRVTDGLVPRPVARATTNGAEARFLFASPAMRGHAVEAGLTLGRSSARSQNLAAPSIAEFVDGLAARVWVPVLAADPSRRRVRQLAGYVNDRIQARPNLTANLGIRLEESVGAAAGAGARLTWHAVLPRAAVRWAPGPATLFAGYGRYQQELPLAWLAFGDPGESVSRVYRWTDRDANGRFDAGELGDLVALAGRGPSVASIDPALRPPRTHELTFGAERSLGRTMAISVTGTVRRTRSLVRSVNVGVPAESYAIKQVPDAGVDYDSAADDAPLTTFDRLPASFGLDRYLLTNVPDDHASYEGLEISWRITRARWWGYAGASAFQTDGAAGNRGFTSDENDQGVIGELFENPNAASFPRGRLFFDRAYVLKLAAGYEAPHDVRLALTARYQDGQPFSRLVVVPDLAQGPELVAAFPNGRTRFTFTATVDAKVEKRLVVGNHAAAVRLEIYNLTNLGLEVEENPLTGPAFRRTTAVQPPRALRVGFLLQF